MNSINLIGRLTRDPEVRYSNEGKAVARYSLAVDRRFKREGEPDADFFNCVAFGKSGEFVEKYFKKGMKIAVTGRVQTGSYTNKDGQRVNTFDVLIDSQEFCESKKDSEEKKESKPAGFNDFMSIPDDSYEELPFH